MRGRKTADLERVLGACQLRDEDRPDVMDSGIVGRNSELLVHFGDNAPAGDLGLGLDDETRHDVVALNPELPIGRGGDKAELRTVV